MALLAAEQHTDELEAWLFDEGKVVTARWLSLVLNLPASQARRILCAFYRTHRGKVHATFLVSGQRADGGAREIMLLSEDTVASEKDRLFSKVHSLQVYGLHVSQKLGQGDLQLLAGDMALARELADAKSDSGESFRLNKLSAVSCSHITISDKPYQAQLPPPPKSEHTSSSSSSTSRATEGPSGASKNNKSKDNFVTFFNRRPATAKDVPEEKAKAKPEESKDNKDTPNKRSKTGDGGAKRKGSGDGGDADVKAATKSKANHTSEKEEGEEDKEGSPPKRARHDPAPEQDEDGEQADKKPEAGENGDDNDVSSSEDEWEPEHKSAEDKQVDKAAKKKAKAKARAKKKRSNSEDGGEGDDVDEEGTKKKTRRKKKSRASPEDEDAVQIVQEPVSGAMDAFVSSSTAPPTDGPRTAKKLVEKSYVDDRGYLVIENVWEEVEVAAPPPAPVPAPPPPKPSQPSQPAGKKSKKDTAKDKQNDSRVQKSMLSFFKRK